MPEQTERRVERIYASKRGTFADLRLNHNGRQNRITLELTDWERETIARLFPLKPDLIGSTLAGLTDEQIEEFRQVERLLLYRGALFVARQRKGQHQ